MRFLVFHLWGPLASWGALTVGNERPTESQPTRSAILGLLANALGYDREDDARQGALAAGLGLAIRTDQEGTRLDDYHTVQSPPKTHRHWATRRGALDVPRTELNTLVTKRQYLADQVDLVVLWRREAGDAPSLEHLAEALRTPARPLSLGRRSCPPGLPIRPHIIEAESLRVGLERTPRGRTHHEGQYDRVVPVLVDGGLDTDLGGALVTTWKSRDEPVSTAQRRFRERIIGQSFIEPASTEVIVPVHQ